MTEDREEQEIAEALKCATGVAQQLALDIVAGKAEMFDTEMWIDALLETAAKLMYLSKETGIPERKTASDIVLVVAQLMAARLLSLEVDNEGVNLSLQ